MGPADGPIIHVITGTIQALRREEHLALTWLHHDMANEPSLVEVSFRSVNGGTELTLAHRRIAARRQLVWTRRAWELMLGRLAGYLAPARPRSESHHHVVTFSGPVARSAVVPWSCR